MAVNIELKKPETSDRRFAATSRGQTLADAGPLADGRRRAVDRVLGGNKRVVEPAVVVPLADAVPVDRRAGLLDDAVVAASLAGTVERLVRRRQQ